MAKKTKKATKTAAKTAKTKTAKKPVKATASKPTASKMERPEPKKISAIASKATKPRTKGDIVNLLAEGTGLTRKEVGTMFTALTDLISLDIGSKGPGAFNVPGLMKITRIQKPATKARKGINPFTGEETVFKAKPARNIVKVRALKALKEMV
jgi:nucleoid DNA-binding protein